MNGKLVFMRVVAPYKKKDGQQSEGGIDLHLMLPESKEENEKGCPVERVWLKNNLLSVEQLKELALKIPCPVRINFEIKMFNGRAYPQISGLEVTK